MIFRADTNYDRRTHLGTGLAAMAKANGLPPKTMTGAHAAIQWQLGFHGNVIDYCLHDVWLTASLYLRALELGGLSLPERVADRWGEGGHLAMPIDTLLKLARSGASD